jgi:hypothetical protein
MVIWPYAVVCARRTSGRGDRFEPLAAEELVVKVVTYLLAGVLGLMGLVSLFGAGQGRAVVRIIIGLVCLAAAGALVALSRLRPQHHVHQLKIDMPGDTSLEQVQCRQCSGTLSSKSVRYVAGAVFISCEYCGAEYQLEEAPKW